MKKVSVLLTASFLTLWLAGCGVGPGTKVTVHVQTDSGERAFPQAVAYRIADGEWAWLSPDKDANYSFYVPQGKKRYGVAVRCPTSGASLGFGAQEVQGLELTLDDVTDPVVVCRSAGLASPWVSVTAQVDVGAVASAQGYELITRTGSRPRGNTSGTERLSFHPDPDQDVILLAYSTASITQFEPDKLLAGRVFRSISPTDGLTLNLSLTSGDALGVAQVQALPLPAGWSGTYGVGLVTHAGNEVRTADLGGGGRGGGPYKTIPGLTSGDYYTLVARGHHSTGRIDLTLSDRRWLDAGSAADLTADFIDPYQEDYAPDTSGELLRFGLDYPGGADAYGFFVWGSEGKPIMVLVSKAWLEGESSYAMPDLTAVPGFGDVNTKAADYIGWEACAHRSSLSLGELLVLPTEDLVPTVNPGAPLELRSACAGNS